MPQIIPVQDLKNTSEISDLCYKAEELSMKKYMESLRNTQDPIPFEQLPKGKMDLVGLSKYASAKGVWC